MKLGEAVVNIDAITTTSPSFIKVGLKLGKIYK